ncbi:venom protein 164-like [Argiope bruennichi]|uniref:venom protein 164-like n=1 Tax=Argiope bruennichi TaxID=94029 RepID=UPI00249529AA|nr:venom protein 164-like [Argiope bruennichi]
MKLLLAAALFTVFLVAGEAGRCRSQDECKSDECCVSRGVLFYRRGECEPLGQKGQKCSENLDARGERYVYHCPCAAGLACELETKNTWFGTVKVNPKCVEDIAHTTPAQTDRTEQPETTLVERETTNVDRETTDVDRETTIVLESTVETQVPDEV